MSVDAAFQNAGKQPGLEAWRIENLKPVPVPASELGRLHNGDSYIFLKTLQEKRCDRRRLLPLSLVLSN